MQALVLGGVVLAAEELAAVVTRVPAARLPRRP